VVWAITDVDATTAITLAIAAARKQTIIASSRVCQQFRTTSRSRLPLSSPNERKVKTLREEVCEGLLEYLELLKSSTRFSCAD